MEQGLPSVQAGSFDLSTSVQQSIERFRMCFIVRVCFLLLVLLGAKTCLFSISADNVSLQAQACLVHVAERRACVVPFYEVVGMDNTDLQCLQTATSHKLFSCAFWHVSVTFRTT